jgi:polygalacturonase
MLGFRERMALARGRVAHPLEEAGGLFDVTDVVRFGARGDGRTLSTGALQKAIDACAAAGGGLVLVPPGRYLTGALTLRSHIHLHLLAGATLLASQRPEDFPVIKGRDEGVERTLHSSMLTGFDLEGVAITGDGVLDGQGAPWWEAYATTWKMRLDAQLPREAENPAGAPLKWPRPRTIHLIRCRGVLIEGLLINDNPFYGIHLTYCEDVLIRKLTTRQQIDAHSTAVVIDSSRRVTIADSVISHGGDGIGIKSGYNEDGRRVGIPAEDIVISNCRLFHYGSSALAIGSETAGGLRNLLVSDCLIAEGKNGIHIRSPRGRGGVVENLRFRNLAIENITEVALRISNFFDSVRMDVFKGSMRRNPETARSLLVPVNEGTPTVRELTFSGITVNRVQQVATLEGLPERFIRGVRFENLEVGEAKAGISCNLAARVTISNFVVGALEGPAVDAREVEALEIHRLRAPRPAPDTPVVWLENTSAAFIHGCDVVPPPGIPAYQWLRQEQSRRVTLASNSVPAPPVSAGKP